MFGLQNILSNFQKPVREEKEVCAICLATVNPHGGECLSTLGCCGKWFHQTCIQELKRTKNFFCPACRTEFAPSPISSPRRVSSRTTNSTTSLRRRSSSLLLVLLEDDIIVPASRPLKSASPISSEEVQIRIIPEFPEVDLKEILTFHARISLSFTPNPVVDANQRRQGLDVVCVLDNSGSMTGQKLENLKLAMEFVIRSLSEYDRLSIVTFNSSATSLQGLWSMNEARQEAAKNNIRQITAHGGTNIYDGMRAGWDLLEQRKARNASSCMFLLTDGQDGSFLSEKKQLAKAMREQGTSLFVFGFGNDHDSTHLLEIANAGEGSFVYIETNDTVVDAFGGAIGSQQGQLLRNIQVEFQMSETNVIVDTILCGSYRNEIEPTWKRSGNVRFADLYGGERRDFILRLKLPAIPAPVESYELFSVRAQYQHYGEEDSVLVTKSHSVTITRLNEIVAPRQPNPEIEEQLQRIEVTATIKEAMNSADKGNYRLGSDSIDRLRKRIESSTTFASGSPVTKGLIDDLDVCRRRVSSYDEYVFCGGKAMLSETSSTYSKQRAIFAKTESMHYMQSPVASASQRRANSYRTPESSKSNEEMIRLRSSTTPAALSPRHIDAIRGDSISDLLEEKEEKDKT